MFKNENAKRLQKLVNQVTSANNADELNTALTELETYVNTLAKEGYSNYIPDIVRTIGNVRIGDATRSQVSECIDVLVEAMQKETMIAQMTEAIKENASAVARLLVDSMFNKNTEQSSSGK